MYNLDNFEAKFKTYLLSQKISSTTIRNYLSDLRHYLGWIRKTNGASQESIITYFTLLQFEEYKSYLISLNLPTKTINRRLSTLRKCCIFLHSLNLIDDNPSLNLSNIKSVDTTSKVTHVSLLYEFESHLKTRTVLDKDIAIYLDDIQDFLNLTSNK